MDSAISSIAINDGQVDELSAQHYIEPLHGTDTRCGNSYHRHTLMISTHCLDIGLELVSRARILPASSQDGQPRTVSLSVVDHWTLK